MTTTPYRSFLLRLWLEPNAPPEWRAMLENPSSGERHGFANLETLFEFIRQETGQMEKIVKTHNPKVEQINANFPLNGDPECPHPQTHKEKTQP